MARLDEIDVNFKSDTITAEDVQFWDCLSAPFKIYGLYEPYKSERFMRLPAYFAECPEVNEGVRNLMFHTAGGRVRFVTDSPYVAIVAEVEYVEQFPHMPATCRYGFDMYVADASSRKDSMYKKTFVPNGLSMDNSRYDGFYEFDDIRMREITINFPLYSAVKKLYIGLQEGCQLEEAQEYTVAQPIVYYGSSVTQGGCASRPGTVYTSLISRWLDADHVNLGFSGSDRGETALAEYIATMPMSVFVYGYGYNSPSIEYFAETYYPFYKIIREKNPDLPIIMMSSPSCIHIRPADLAERMTKRRAIVMKAYLQAVEEGDQNVYFVDGFSLLGTLEAEEATVDQIHPTDHGFYYMAKTLYPVLKSIIKK